MENVKVLNTIEEVVDLSHELKGVEIIGVDTEVYQPNHYTNHLLTVQVSDGTNVWVINYTRAKDITSLKNIFEDEKTLKIFQNASFDIKVLHEFGIPNINNIYDTLIAEKLLTAGIISNADLGSLSEKYTEVNVIKNAKDLNFENLYETGNLTKEQLEYSAKDAVVLKEIFEGQMKEIESQEIVQVFKLEMDLLPVVVKMEEKGLYIDVKSWSKLIENLTKQRDEINMQIQDLVREHYDSSNIGMFGGADEVINLNSPKQVLELFNEKLGIKIKSTREYQLAKIDHEVARLILKYREHEKLVRAFGNNLLEKVNPNTNRIHSSFKQLGADTGRFSSQDPNFQQIPASGIGKDIRSYFKPEKGYDFVIADYSQQELRILAYYSKDPGLITAFNKGLDLHKYTASLVFGVELDKVTNTERNKAKTLNFGIVYGMGSRALAQSLDISIDDAAELLAKYNKTFPNVRQFLDKMGREAIAKGYTKTLYGRKRFYTVPKVKSDDYERQLAGIKRAAMNHPFQGSGADMIKLALVTINKRLTTESLDATIVNTIHDELVVECKDDISGRVKNIVEEEMSNSASKLMPDIPIKVGAVVAESWGEK